MQQNTSSAVPTVSGEIEARGANAVEILLNDHTNIKALLQQLTQATDHAMRKQTLEQLKGLLTIHNATEENLVYPAIALDAGKKSESLHLYHETAAADMLVFQLDTMLKEGDTSKFEATAKALQKAILEHVDDEETKAFPHLQKHADPQHAQMLTESVREFRSSLKYKPPSKG